MRETASSFSRIITVLLVFFEPSGRIGTGGSDFSALFADLVYCHLDQKACDALSPEFIADVGMIDRVNARLSLRKGDLRQDLSVFILALDTVRKSDIVHSGVTLLLPLWRKAQVHARIRDED